MANAKGRREREREKCVRVSLIEAGRKRRKKDIAVKIERDGDIRGHMHDSVRT